MNVKTLLIASALTILSFNGYALERTVTKPLIDEAFKKVEIKHEKLIRAKCGKDLLNFDCTLPYQEELEAQGNTRGTVDYAIVHYAGFDLKSLKKLKKDLLSLQKRAKVNLAGERKLGELDYDILEKEIGFVNQLILEYLQKNCKTSEIKTKVGGEDYVYQSFNC